MTPPKGRDLQNKIKKTVNQGGLKCLTDEANCPEDH